MVCNRPSGDDAAIRFTLVRQRFIEMLTWNLRGSVKNWFILPLRGVTSKILLHVPFYSLSSVSVSKLLLFFLDFNSRF